MRYRIIEITSTLYQVEDTASGIICQFHKGRFNETQRFASLPSNTDANTLARLMREMGDYLAINYRDIVL
ncbi:MAG: hypothetical protein J6R25_00790 [Bacteroidales bacterium]|nr:hypothetical protein [Bacteroidales bacterium]